MEKKYILNDNTENEKVKVEKGFIFDIKNNKIIPLDGTGMDEVYESILVAAESIVKSVNETKEHISKLEKIAEENKKKIEANKEILKEKGIDIDE